MSENKTYPAPEEFVAQANITAAQYEEMYQQSVDDPEGFWSEQAENYLSWFKPWNSVCDWSFDEQDLARLSLVGEQAAIVLHNALFVREAQRAGQQESRFLDLVSEVSTEIQLGPLLQKIMVAVTGAASRPRILAVVHTTNAAPASLNFSAKFS